MIHKVTIFGCILQVVSDSMLAELKQCFLEAYDDNNDGKIDIREVKTKNTFAFCLGYICTCCKKNFIGFWIQQLLHLYITEE